MKHSLLSIAAASMLVASVGIASAQENPAKPSWTADQSMTLTTTSQTMHYSMYSDASMHPEVGMVLPEAVHIYPLPDAMHGPAYSGYSYGMINEHPVIVMTTTRKVVHTWN